jgi:hypothetical protein
MFIPIIVLSQSAVTADAGEAEAEGYEYPQILAILAGRRLMKSWSADAGTRKVPIGSDHSPNCHRPFPMRSSG